MFYAHHGMFKNNTKCLYCVQKSILCRFLKPQTINLTPLIPVFKRLPALDRPSMNYPQHLRQLPYIYVWRHAWTTDT